MSINGVKKVVKQIEKAIGDIGNVLDEDDPLTILMAFSWDPTGALHPLLALINQVSADIAEVDKQIGKRKNNLGASGSEEDSDNLYKEEITIIDGDIALLKVLR